MLPFAHLFVKVQGFGEVMPNNMFLLSTLKHGILLNILLGPLNYDSQGFSSETHVLGSWVENKITHHWLWWDNLPWVVMMSWDMSPIDEVEDLGLKPIMWCRENVDRKFASRNWATGLIHLVE